MPDNNRSYNIDLGAIEFPEEMNIRTAALYLGLSEMRVRALLRTEELKAEKVNGVWSITRAALDEWKATPRQRRSGGGGGTRGDGKLWQIRVKYDQLQQVKDALAALEIELEPRYKYSKKAKAKAEADASAEPVSGTEPEPAPKAKKHGLLQ